MIVRNLDIIKRWDRQDLGGKRPDKSVLVIRYGGFGDLLQASSIFPRLKADGWYVCVNTETRGFDIIRNDPNVDEFFVQEVSQVKNEELGPYWDKLGSNFTKTIKLIESVERELLAIPVDPIFKAPYKERHRKMNVDYFHRIHEIADVPLPPKPAFYPSKAERKWAEKERAKLGMGNFVLLWPLSGSSVHKAYPHMDSVIASLMLDYSGLRVVFVGDACCQILEENWRNEKRVLRKSLKWSIRETLAFAQVADLVIGPETGVLNSVAYTNIPKIIFLSHSSPVNLGGNWLNTTVMTPIGCDCYPCHQLHYGWETCNRYKPEDEDDYMDGAMCQVLISPDRVLESIREVIEIKRKAA